jgi:hypothetical protein
LFRPLALAARTLLLPSMLLVLGAALIACSSNSSAESKPPTTAASISIATVTPAVENGGKPAQPGTSTPVAAAPGTTGTVSGGGSAPTSGKWIDVDATKFIVKLMNGTQVVQTIQPVAVGANLNTGQYESTQTGLFTVYNKIAGLQYDAPYDAYIADWVAFDPAKDNGFHSFLLDSDGDVTDPRTGRVSNGCIRTGASKAIFDFAEVGMQVYVHL